MSPSTAHEVVPSKNAQLKNRMQIPKSGDQSMMSTGKSIENSEICSRSRRDMAKQIRADTVDTSTRVKFQTSLGRLDARASLCTRVETEKLSEWQTSKSTKGVLQQARQGKQVLLPVLYWTLSTRHQLLL